MWPRMKDTKKVIIFTGDRAKLVVWHERRVEPHKDAVFSHTWGDNIPM